jgi:hypothetical protein
MAALVRPLFGGALQASIPSSFRDVSDVRQVPDHQECWQDVDENSLLVIEILDRQQDVNDEQAAAFFYQDLCESNGVSPDETTFTPQTQQQQQQQGQTQITIVGLPPTSIILFGVGTQHVAMGRDFDVDGNRRQQEERWIRVELCVIRLLSVGTDLLITLSTPCEQNPQESSSTTTTFQQVVSTFQILDWTLFA